MIGITWLKLLNDEPSFSRPRHSLKSVNKTFKVGHTLPLNGFKLLKKSSLLNSLFRSLIQHLATKAIRSKP
jgi:hypothetical protein